MLTSGSYATGIREPCQGRNAAALSGSSCVPWGRLGRVNCRGNVCDWCSTQDARIFNIAGKTLLREGAVLTLSSNQALPWQVILTQESFVVICPLSSRQVNYQKRNAYMRPHNITCGRIFYAHHFSLYFSIRLFRGIKYSAGYFVERASVLTSNGVLQLYLSCGRSSL